MERLYRTSAGVGHVYILPAPFQPRSCGDGPLPPHLRQRSRVPGPLHYSLTSHTEHDPKPINGPLRNLVYSKASPHWDTHSLNDLAQKLRDSRSVKVVSEPVSEMQDRYRGQSAAQGPFSEHYRDLLVLYGQLDRAPALLPKEPLLSTAHADYRSFSRSELAPPSGLSAPTVQQTLTKSGALSRLPPHKAPASVASQLQLPRPRVALPHAGRSSLYMDSFTVPACLPKLSTTHDGVRRRNEGGRSLQQHVLQVPKMYGTESQTYGKGKMMRV